jgi:hypothetical protein
MVCCVRFGAGIFTITYGVFIYLILTEFETPCPTEPCRSKGVDNATINWASDYFVAGCVTLLAFHLLCFQRLCHGFTPLLLMGTGRENIMALKTIRSRRQVMVVVGFVLVLSVRTLYQVSNSSTYQLSQYIVIYLFLKEDGWVSCSPTIQFIL